MNVLPLLMVSATILSFLKNAKTSPTVQVNDSQIVGQRVNSSGRDVNQYLGVPYAQPPLGHLRFKKPLPVQKYAPVFRADTNPPDCPQCSPYQPSLDTSEDCLFLNIWTPAGANATNKKAVLYWIYGGGFRFGSIASDEYSGIPLSALGDIIVVTVNYRVGPFGFLTSGTEDAPPNVGLWDILEGLKWVNQNIESFGGDFHRITISGQSAGAIAVGFLTISPMAKGLYTRLIMESGSPFNRVTDDNTMNIALSQRLAKKVGCANDTYTIEIYPEQVVQCMRDVNAGTLSMAEFELDPGAVFLFNLQWGTDELLPDNPRTAVKKGNFRCKDLLIGNKEDEGSLLLTTADRKVYGFFGEKNPSINKTLGQDTVQKAVNSFPNSRSIVQYYIPDNSSDHNKIRHQAYTALGDTVLLCPDVYYAEKCAEQDQNVYFYFFTHRPSVTPWAKWMGVAHFEEVQFIFGQPILNPKKYQPSEVSLSHHMIDIWSNFVKHGKPSIPWPLYSRKNPSFKYLGPNNTTEKNGVGPHLENCNFLRKYFKTNVNSSGSNICVVWLRIFIVVAYIKQFIF